MNELVLDRKNDIALSKMRGRVKRVGTTEEKFLSKGKGVKGVHV